MEIVRVGQLRTRDQYERALRELLINQLNRASPMPTFVTLPREPRAIAVARAVLKDPSQPKSLVALCAGAGVSVRTIERIFRRDVGIDFESWRRQVRLTKAIKLLVAGHSIKEAAYGVGYRQSSPFVELFRRTFGTTPKAWITALEKLN